MNVEAGYLKARKLLESKFGQKHKIAMAYVDKVTIGPAFKAEDTEALGRRGGLLVRALVLGASGLGLFLGKTLNSHSASLHPGV